MRETYFLIKNPCGCLTGAWKDRPGDEAETGAMLVEALREGRLVTREVITQTLTLGGGCAHENAAPDNPPPAPTYRERVSAALDLIQRGQMQLCRLFDGMLDAEDREVLDEHVDRYGRELLLNRLKEHREIIVRLVGPTPPEPDDDDGDADEDSEATLA